ncbi:hypothetical protein [Phenylobacterium sp.]|uniref:hypothetical protein n=1 Tax=Phenylobacterium sp. TaxID=1871053 RepID=UPI0025D6F41E|nr:hypothetical protein [Phenylobacterium sp.]
MQIFKRLAWTAGAVLALLGAAPAGATTFSVSFPKAASAAPLDGRLILIVSPEPTPEPRLQVELEAPLRTPYIFGQTVDAMAPGAPIALSPAAVGWPAARLEALPDGDYTVQAVLNRYETYHRADGSVVKLPPDMGEGQHWNEKPGNLYSTPMLVKVRHGGPAVAIRLDQVIAPIARKTDTEFVRHIRIKSELLSKYWGRPVYLGAHVLVPAGFDKHPQARFPLMVFHGHYPDDISGFRTTPPDADLKPDYSERFHLAGYNRIQQEEAYAFYQRWIARDFPRFLVIEIEHANPYYDDSYAVNSANLGPYGDAINKELIPYIEKQFRGLGEGWARFTYGGSTGGWEAMATQVFYPDLYNGAFIACPDPIDFRAYTTINLYENKNAFYEAGVVNRIERPAMRDYLGQTLATQRDENQMEAVLGDHGRSGGQYDIWQAVFSPQGPDGYPKPIIDKRTGAIDPAVAAYWREHFDLTHIVVRDWATLGPKLKGKLHIYVGSADSYFLTDAVYLAQEKLEALKDPAWGGEVAYGERAEHCWNGDPKLANAYSRLHYDLQYLPSILQRIEATAPQGADLTSWRY